MITKAVWILGFTVFGHHWRGIKLYEDVITWDGNGNSSELNAVFAERTKVFNELTEMERVSASLVVGGV